MKKSDYNEMATLEKRKKFNIFYQKLSNTITNVFLEMQFFYDTNLKS